MEAKANVCMWIMGAEMFKNEDFAVTLTEQQAQTTIMAEVEAERIPVAARSCSPKHTHAQT